METIKIQLGSIDLNATIKTKEGRYGDSYILYIGKIPIAKYYYNGARSKGDLLCYKVEGVLSNLKQNLANYETEQECIEFLTKLATYVFEKILAEEPK